MKILIVGSGGMLGRELARRLPGFSSTGHSFIEIITASHKTLDITHRQETFEFITRVVPDVIINCAAFTDVDACEKRPSDAFAVNAGGVRNIAIAGRHVHAKIIQISTDYVFDGTREDYYTEDDTPNPISVYGKSKLEGEMAVREISDTYCIIRTAWLYGSYKKNFVTAILDRGRKNQSVSVVTDQHGSPTYTADLAYAIWTAVKLNLQGIYHIANTGKCSRYEWAKEIFELTGNRIPVYPIRTEDFKRAASVPQNSALDCKKYIMASGEKIRPWQAALKEYIQNSILHTT